MPSNLSELREMVLEANLELVRQGLLISTFGNASGILPEESLVAIKPSGVDYDVLTPDMLVITDLDGNVVDGNLRPSSDLPTHLVLYRSFESIGGVVHTHSTYATSWAQACRTIPCFGTTHADIFHGPVPMIRQLTDEEIEEAYEEHTGNVIIERFHQAGINPIHFPGVLLPHHGPFTWGKTGEEAVNTAIALEETARMAFLSLQIYPETGTTPQSQLDKHFLRKHGPGAYYGQK